jgi:LDH2 family malate/lactate/ureidoglycolate dehydrogenase
MATPVSPDAPVDHLVIPGDPEHEAETRNTELGIPVRQEVLVELQAMCDAAGIPFTL